jgi:hypothetical protein
MTSTSAVAISPIDIARQLDTARVPVSQCRRPLPWARAHPDSVQACPPGIGPRHSLPGRDATVVRPFECRKAGTTAHTEREASA